MVDTLYVHSTADDAAFVSLKRHGVFLRFHSGFQGRGAVSPETTVYVKVCRHQCCRSNVCRLWGGTPSVMGSGNAGNDNPLAACRRPREGLTMPHFMMLLFIQA